MIIIKKSQRTIIINMKSNQYCGLLVLQYKDKYILIKLYKRFAYFSYLFKLYV